MLDIKNEKSKGYPLWYGSALRAYYHTKQALTDGEKSAP